MCKIFWFQLDFQILFGMVFCYCIVVDWFKFKVGDQCVMWGFCNDVEGVCVFLVVVFVGVFVINFGFLMNKDVSQYVIGFVLCVQYFLVWVEYFVQCCQQMCFDDVVLFWFNLEVGVFLCDFFYCWQ